MGATLLQRGAIYHLIFILMNRSKSLKAAYEKFDREATYPLEEAVKMMVSNSTVKFDATAELHINLNIDPKQADQQIRSTLSLPHGTGKSVRVAVFCEDDQVKAAKAAGAVEAGGAELIDKVVQKGWTDFDVAVAQPAMMKLLGKAAKVLGPKGLMPNPKAGTVTPDIEKAVKELCAGRLEYRNDKFGLIHSIFGKLSFGEAKLVENLINFINTVKDSKPSGVKGTFIKTITINSTMGPGIKVDFNN